MGQTIRDYEDINENLRYWFDRVFDSLTDPVFYDIGANDGVFSLGYAAASRVVHAFEPSEQACSRLVERALARKIDNIVAHRVALSDSNGTMRLHRFSDDTFNSLYPRAEDQLAHYSLQAGEAEEVTVVRLDDLVSTEHLPPPDVVKIDIEGAELFALRGAQHTIRSAMPVILVEYSVDNTANAGYDRREIATLLRGWGYDVRGLLRNRDTALHSGESLEQRSIWNLLCFPPTSREVS
ncbi:MAG: FkbM family methyltransferase [Spirochaetota bacterium]